MQINAIEINEWKNALKTLKLLSVLPDTDICVSLTACPDNKLLVQCQTTSASFRLTLTGDTDKTGTVVASKEILDKLVFSGKNLSLASKDNQLLIKAGRSQYSIGLLAKSKAVLVPEMDGAGDDIIQLPSGTLQHAIATTWFGQSDDGGEDIRVLAGKGLLIVEAADAMRCAYCIKKIPTWKDAAPSMFVIKKVVLAGLLKSFEKTDILALRIVKDKSIIINNGTHQVELPTIGATALYEVRKEVKEHTTRLKVSANLQFKSEDIRGVADGITSVLRNAEQGRKLPVELMVKKGFLIVRAVEELAKFSTRIPVAGDKDAEPFKVLNKHFSSFLNQAQSAGTEGTIKVWGKDLVTIEFNTETDRVLYALPQVVG